MITALLWVLFYAIVIAIVGLIVIRVLKVLGVPIEGRVEQLIYLAYGVLVLIWVVAVLLGGGGGISIPLPN